MSSAEIWKPVYGYEGYYEVSSLGQVRSLDRVIIYPNGAQVNYRGKVLKQRYNDRYMRVGLTRGGVTDSWCIHRLVADAFHEPKPSKTSVVRHLNGDHLDNRPENLRWGTAAENSADMVAHGHSHASLTHCKRGHEFSSENTRKYRGRRVCRACERLAGRRKAERSRS